MLGSWPEAEPARTGSAAAGYTGILAARVQTDDHSELRTLGLWAGGSFVFCGRSADSRHAGRPQIFWWAS